MLWLLKSGPASESTGMHIYAMHIMCIDKLDDELCGKVGLSVK